MSQAIGIIQPRAKFIITLFRRPLNIQLAILRLMSDHVPRLLYYGAYDITYFPSYPVALENSKPRVFECQRDVELCIQQTQLEHGLHFMQI